MVWQNTSEQGAHETSKWPTPHNRKGSNGNTMCFVVFTWHYHKTHPSKSHVPRFDITGIRRAADRKDNCTYLLPCFVLSSSRIHCCTWHFQAVWKTKCEIFRNRENTQTLKQNRTLSRRRFTSLYLKCLISVKQKEVLERVHRICLTLCLVCELQRWIWEGSLGGEWDQEGYKTWVLRVTISVHKFPFQDRMQVLLLIILFCSLVLDYIQKCSGVTPCSTIRNHSRQYSGESAAC